MRQQRRTNKQTNLVNERGEKREKEEESSGML